jgi:cytochrome P450
MVRTSSNDPGGNGSEEAAVPALDKDSYSTEYLIDPYTFHEELREAGPVAWLEAYDVWSTGRHEHVRGVLTDWRTFMSGAGVGLIDLRVDAWRPPSLLEADPPTRPWCAGSSSASSRPRRSRYCARGSGRGRRRWWPSSSE